MSTTIYADSETEWYAFMAFMIDTIYVRSLRHTKFITFTDDDGVIVSDSFYFGGGREGVLLRITDFCENDEAFDQVWVQPFETEDEWWQHADEIEYKIDGEWVTFQEIMGML